MWRVGFLRNRIKFLYNCTYFGPLSTGEDLGRLEDSKPSIQPGSHTDTCFTEALLISLPPASHWSAGLSGTEHDSIGDDGRCGGGEVEGVTITLDVALPTLGGTLLIAAFFMTSDVFQAFSLAFSVWETISSMSGEGWCISGCNLSVELWVSSRVVFTSRTPSVPLLL